MIKAECRIVTNDRYAQNACVVTETQFLVMCMDAFGDGDYDFSDAGPIVASEDDVLEHCGPLSTDECVRQYRALVA